ncbi:hypothetical protein [Acidimangrovimonas pyrenivorans]|uniref:Uncharacterized protein n=1 Tax=Acidimangrovimonas pyrenivorans TaxID=2030798 RepID=A0ABV7AEW5_9RHOB
MLEGIKRAKYLDSEELACLWHFKERKDRFQTSEFFIDVEAVVENAMHQVVDGRYGLTIEVTRGASPQGPIKSLSIYR